jgi:CheY-like chemotaxis protein
MPPTPRTSRPAPRPIQSDHGRANTLGLGKTELEAILESLDAEGAGKGTARRESSRLAFRINGVPLDITQPGGGQTRIHVAGRNLSRSGLGFLHSSYMHPGTTVTALLPHRNLGPQKIEGTLVRCRHVTRHIHDCGVRFKQPINLRDYMDLDAQTQAFSCEKVDAASLKGAVLIIAEYRIEASCIESMLLDTALDVSVADNLVDGFDLAVKGADLILCDYAFQSGSGTAFIDKARSAGVRCPILIMSADASPQVAAAVRDAHATGFLPKPIEKSTLLRALAEFMLSSGRADTETGHVMTTLPADSPLLGLAEKFVEDLKKVAGEVESLAKADDVEAIRRQVLRVAGAAPALGFDPVARLGNDLLKALAATMAVSESLVQLNTFVSVCRSAQRRPPGEAPPAKPDAAPAPAGAPAPAAKPHAPAGH